MEVRRGRYANAYTRAGLRGLLAATGWRVAANLSLQLSLDGPSQIGHPPSLSDVFLLRAAAPARTRVGRSPITALVEPGY